MPHSIRKDDILTIDFSIDTKIIVRGSGIAEICRREESYFAHPFVECNSKFKSSLNRSSDLIMIMDHKRFSINKTVVTGSKFLTEILVRYCSCGGTHPAFDLSYCDTFLIVRNHIERLHPAAFEMLLDLEIAQGPGLVENMFLFINKKQTAIALPMAVQNLLRSADGR